MNFIVQAKTNFMGKNQHFDVFGNAHTYLTNTKYFRGKRLKIGDPLAIFFEDKGIVVFGTVTKVEDDEADEFWYTSIEVHC